MTFLYDWFFSKTEKKQSIAYVLHSRCENKDIDILWGCHAGGSVLQCWHDDQKGRSGMKTSGYEILFHKKIQALEQQKKTIEMFLIFPHIFPLKLQ